MDGLGCTGGDCSTEGGGEVDALQHASRPSSFLQDAATLQEAANRTPQKLAAHHPFPQTQTLRAWAPLALTDQASSKTEAEQTAKLDDKVGADAHTPGTNAPCDCEYGLGLTISVRNCSERAFSVPYTPSSSFCLQRSSVYLSTNISGRSSVHGGNCE